MRFGIRLFSLWRLRPWVAASFVFALLMSVWSVANISLTPPGLRLRSFTLASASTHLVVDTPQSSMLDLRVNTDSFQAMTQRAVLLGNVVATGSVRAAIAATAHVSTRVLVVEPPLTPAQPTPQPGAYNNSVKSVARSTNQYRISVLVNPTVPIMDIYAQAPSAATAAQLANGTVTALRDYLERLAATQGTPAQDRIRLTQLGQARGTVIDQGISVQVAVLVFLVTFVLTCASVVFVSRVREGLRSASLAETGVAT